MILEGRPALLSTLGNRMFRRVHFPWRVLAVYFVGAVLLGIQAALLAWSAYIHSPTPDEIAYMPSGISHWHFGRFELYRANPPLVRMVAVLPVLAVGCRTDWTQFDGKPGHRTEFRCRRRFSGRQWLSFILAVHNRSLGMHSVRALGWRHLLALAHELYGPISGLVALSLWCFCPNVLGNGALITPDVATSSLGITATYAFWKWLKSPNWRYALFAGLTLGLAELAKTNWLILFPLFPAIWLAWRIGRWHTPCAVTTCHQLAQLATILILAIFAINLGYDFDGTFKPLGEFQFMSHVLRGHANAPQQDHSLPVLGNRFRNTALAKLPVPLPEQYVVGIDVQKHAG